MQTIIKSLFFLTSLLSPTQAKETNCCNYVGARFDSVGGTDGRPVSNFAATRIGQDEIGRCCHNDASTLNCKDGSARLNDRMVSDSGINVKWTDCGKTAFRKEGCNTYFEKSRPFRDTGFVEKQAIKQCNYIGWYWHDVSDISFTCKGLVVKMM